MESGLRLRLRRLRLYIGACRDCEATVSHALAERNPVGYAGTNSGGHVVLEDSLFRNNAVGLSLNSSESDPPPPQLGSCDANTNRSATPTIGGYGDLVTGNILARNRSVGILGLEFPWWRPARRRPVHFQLAGNRIERNAVSGSRISIAIEGGLFGSKRSTNNCFSKNRYASSLPADLRPFTCAKARTPNPAKAASERILALVAKLHSQFLTRRAHGQPAPPPQPTMPNPCAGAPSNPLCPS